MTSLPVSSNHKRKNKNILAVDDEPDMTKMLKMALGDIGFSIDVFNDPLLALESFKPTLYDLVILDVIMKKMNGFELYNQLKKIEPGIKICFLTASTEQYRETLGQCELNKELFLNMPLPLKEIIDEIMKRIEENRFIMLQR